jgi:F0F1-type ATP synthase assembly protein I
MSTVRNTAESFIRQTHQPADNDGIRIIAEMLAGILLYGGLGWGADWLFDTGFLKFVGCIIGVGLSIYLVYKRHLASTPATAAAKPATVEGGVH